MVVQCPHCSARYRVNDQNIPAGGGRIRCPSCESTFVVYPEEQPPANPQPPGASYDEGKTSVATNIQDLMRGGGMPGQASGSWGAGPPAGGADDGLATEVISGDSLPNFASGFGGGGSGGGDSGGVPDDGTVEMENPIDFAGVGLPPGWGASAQQEEDYDPTQVVSADVAASAVQGGAAGGRVRGGAEERRHRGRRPGPCGPVPHDVRGRRRLDRGPRR